MEYHHLGRTGPSVSAVGLGCMGMSGMYGPSDRGESLDTIAAAVDSGINLLDTGDFYGMGHNEMLIGEALRRVPRHKVVLSVKFNVMRDPAGAPIGFDSRPVAVRNFLAYSLRRLGVEYIDIYRPARLDPAVPVEDTVGAIADLVKAGYVRHIGLSEVGPDTIRRAAAVHPIVDLQVEYSLFSREIEDETLPLCRELGIGITAYGILLRGLVGGSAQSSETSAQGDLRRAYPRFQGNNRIANLKVVEAMQSVATRRGISAAQAAIAWVAGRGHDIIPLIGARTPQRLAEALAALPVDLTREDNAALEEAVPKGAIIGDRYPAGRGIPASAAQTR